MLEFIISRNDVIKTEAHLPMMCLKLLYHRPNHFGILEVPWKNSLSRPLDGWGHMSPPLGKRRPRARNSRNIRDAQSLKHPWLPRPVMGAEPGRRMEEQVAPGTRHKGGGWGRTCREEGRSLEARNSPNSLGLFSPCRVAPCSLCLSFF